MLPFLVKNRRLTLLLALVLVGVCPRAQAQSVNSGSTGANGALAPTISQTITLPPSGVLNYTTINIPSGVTITFQRNAANTPVTILASGDVTIAGTIDVSGGDGTTTVSGTGTGAQAFHTVPGTGGPGGYDGGGGGVVTTFTGTANGTAGEGPGGGGGGLGSADGSVLGDGGGGGFGTAGTAGNRTGTGATANDGAAGMTYGAGSLLQLVGGSGGGGGGGGYQAQGGNGPTPGVSGGGGGGAMVIASSGTITFGSSIFGGTLDAHGGSSNNFFSAGGHGGGGAGGAIRVVATTLAGNVGADVQGGNGYAGGAGGDGYPPRFEAYNFRNFQVTVGSSPLSSFQPVYALPSSVTLPSPPSLLITSVAGMAAPAIPNGSFHKAPDITLPTTQTNPVTVAVRGANIPVGTVTTVEVSPEQGAQSFVQSTPLAGTSASSTTATASVTLPPSLMSILYAAATIDLTLAQPSVHPAPKSVGRLALPAAPLVLNGERVTRVEVKAAYGGTPQVTYITTSGKRYLRSQLLGTQGR